MPSECAAAAFELAFVVVVVAAGLAKQPLEKLYP